MTRSDDLRCSWCRVPVRVVGARFADRAGRVYCSVEGLDAQARTERSQPVEGDEPSGGMTGRRF